MSVSRVILTLVASLFVAPLVGLAQQSETKPLIVCSTTQVADFARQVVGNRWDVVSILAPGQDPHVYEIKATDTQLVARAELCLENGWHLEGKDWMKTLAANSGKQLITCADGAEPIELEDSGQRFHDPHAWFSPQNAAVYVRNIVRGVSAVDPEREAEYKSRADLYLGQLRTLHLWIQREVNAIPADRRILVTSHDAFNYFCREYGFKSAAPAGWSTSDEIGAGVTPERRRLAVESIRKFGVKAIFVETSVNPTLIRQIASDAGVNVGGELYSDSMGAPGSAGETYLGMMRENVLTIVAALK
jgi:manganese/iron transport system substrate-binding protein